MASDPVPVRVAPARRKTRLQVLAGLSCVGSVHRVSLEGFSDSDHSHPPLAGYLAQTPFLLVKGDHYA